MPAQGVEINAIGREPGYEHLAGDRSALTEEWFARKVEALSEAELAALKPTSALGRLWRWLKDALHGLTTGLARPDWTAREMREIMALSKQALKDGGPVAEVGRVKLSGGDLFLADGDFLPDGTPKPEVLAQIEAEKAEIKRRAQADGSWMKAPNGKPTKLNEGQWVAVRTRRFKQWFGDWEAASRQQTFTQAIAAAQSVLSSRQDRDSGIYRPEIGGSVTFTFGPAAGTPSKSYHDGAGLEHIMLARLAEGATMEQAARHLSKVVEAVAYGSFDPATLSDKTRPVILYQGLRVVLARQMFGKSVRWLVTGYEANKKSTDATGGGSVPLRATQLRPTLGQAELVAVDNGKLPSGESAVNPDSVSKVVDENGEPRVVYHGTNASFGEFRASDGMYGRGVYLAKDPDYASGFADQEGGNVMPVFAVITGNGDGRILPDKRGGIWVAAAPTQLKSATANVGTYSGQRGNIRYSMPQQPLGPDQSTRTFGGRVRPDPRLSPETQQAMGPEAVYDIARNKDTFAAANALIDQHGLAGAEKILFDEGNGLSGHVRVTLGQQLIMRLDKAARETPDKAARQPMREAAARILDYTDRKGTEAGQTVQAFAMWARMSPEGVLMHYDRKLKEANGGVLSQLPDALLDKLGELRDQINALPDGITRAPKMHEMLTELARYDGVPISSLFGSLWYANLLSGLTTQGINVCGNGLHLALRNHPISRCRRCDPPPPSGC